MPKRNTFHRWLSGALPLLLWFCLGSAHADPRLQTLVVAVPNDPASLDPATNRAEPIGSEIILNLFDTLVAWAAPDFTRLEGRLAQSWQFSADGRTLDLRLRAGVRFQDGQPVTADAVRFSLERTRRLNAYMTSSFAAIERIDVQGPLRLSLHLREALPFFPALLAQPQAAIVSPASLEDGAQPVGSGAFRLRRYQPDTSVILERNPDYFRGPARLQHVVYRIIPDASTRRLELKYGGVDISQQNGQLSSIPIEDIASFKKDGRVEVLQASSQIVRQLEFNNSAADSPVRDLRVRQAMAWAVDYDGLIKGVLGGTAERVYGPLPSASPFFDPGLPAQAFHYAPDKARALLAEAGYQPGDIHFTLYTFQGSIWNSVATFLQANFAAVGIEVAIQQTEFPVLRDLHTRGQFEIALDGRQPWYNDPDAHITIGYLSSLADTAMTLRMPSDAALDGLIREAQGSLDEARRLRLYQRLQRQLLQRVPAIYLFSNKLLVFKRREVQGLQLNSAPPLNEYWSVYKEPSP